MRNTYYSVHYLKVHGVGVLTPGEFLSEKHLAAIDKARLDELIADGEVKAVGIAPEQSETTNGQDDADGDTEQDMPDGVDEQVDPENPPMDNSDEEDGEEPEPLDIPDDLVNDATEDAHGNEEPKKPKKPKAAGRRKAK